MYLSKVEIALHSADADLLFAGGKNKKQFIPGFYFTQKRLNALFAMGMKENPFAEAALMEVDFRLEEVEQLIQEYIDKSKQALAQAEQEGMRVLLLTRNKPLIHEVDYATEYSNLLAKMMLQVDRAFRYIRTAHSSGYMDEELATEMIRSLRKKVRMVFDRISSYAKKIEPSVRREDIKNNSARAKNMIKKLGRPNEKILTREATFKHKRIPELGL